MSLRFRRTLRLLPGVRLNLSRSGLSATIGARGLGMTVGKRGTYLHAGAPGTGLSARERLDTTSAPAGQASPIDSRRPDVHHGYVLLLLAAVAALVIALR